MQSIMFLFSTGLIEIGFTSVRVLEKLARHIRFLTVKIGCPINQSTLIYYTSCAYTYKLYIKCQTSIKIYFILISRMRVPISNNICINILPRILHNIRSYSRTSNINYSYTTILSFILSHNPQPLKKKLHTLSSHPTSLTHANLLFTQHSSHCQNHA